MPLFLGQQLYEVSLRNPVKDEKLRREAFEKAMAKESRRRSRAAAAAAEQGEPSTSAESKSRRGRPRRPPEAEVCVFFFHFFLLNSISFNKTHQL